VPSGGNRRRSRPILDAPAIPTCNRASQPISLPLAYRSRSTALTATNHWRKAPCGNAWCGPDPNLVRPAPRGHRFREPSAHGASRRRTENQEGRVIPPHVAFVPQGPPGGRTERTSCSVRGWTGRCPWRTTRTSKERS
jgi:hypothetical protein